MFLLSKSGRPYIGFSQLLGVRHAKPIIIMFSDIFVLKTGPKFRCVFFL